MILATCHCWDVNKNQFPSCTSHISSPRSPPVASGCHVGQHRYGTFPSLPSALSIGWHYLRKCRAVTLTWVWVTSLLFFPAYLLPCTVLFKSGSPGARTCLFTDHYYLFVSKAGSREGRGDLQLKGDSSWQEDQWGKQVVISETFTQSH